MANADQPAATASPLETLPRVLGPLDAIAVVVGSIIGSGIFLKASTVAKELESFGPIISVWILIGVVTLCGSLALAELAAMLPHAGGPYVYLREAYGPLPAFLWGWTEFWIIRTGSIGALACATVIYLNELVPMTRLTQGLTAIAIVAGLSAINVFSTRWGAAVQNAATIAKVLFLIGIIVLPVLLQEADVSRLQPVWPREVSGSFWRAFGLAMIAVLWPYDGWINIAPVAEEIRNPQKNVPLGLIVGMLVVIAVYVGTNISYHLMLTMDELIATPAVASAVCERLFSRFGDFGGQLAAIGVMCSTFGAVNSNMLTGPRIYFAMARDGFLPARIRDVHQIHRTPANAIWIQAAWTIVLLTGAYFWESDLRNDPRDVFDALTDFVIFGGSIFYAMAVGAVFVLRRTRPDLPRPYRTWGYPVTPLLYLGVFAAAMVSMLLDKPAQSAKGTILIFGGVIYYYLMRRWNASRISPPSS